MKIGFDGKRAFLNRRGLGNYSRDLLRLLFEYAPDNDYFLFTPKQSEQSFLKNAKAQIVLPSGFARIVPSLWRSALCVSDIKRLDLDIYHGLSGELPYGIHRLYSVRKFVTIHDALFVRYPDLYSPTYVKLFTKKVEYACEVADVIIAISEQTKRDCIEFFGADESKIRVVYQGCNNSFREKRTADNRRGACEKYQLPDNYLLDVGAIEPRKNLERLLYALADSKIDMPLVVIGAKSKYAEKMKVLASDLKLNVLFRHNVDFKDFPAIYQSSFALIYPSIFEGFGIPILEGMCSEVPVLTSSGSCFAETGGDAVLYANPLDVDDISAKLRMLFDASRREEMIERGKLQCEKFTDANVVRNVLDCYQHT